jgi:hypothetical protein
MTCDGQFGWSFAEPGDCDYCGARDVLVFEEPFGNKPACRPCWEQICFGDDE